MIARYSESEISSPPVAGRPASVSFGVTINKQVKASRRDRIVAISWIIFEGVLFSTLNLQKCMNQARIQVITHKVYKSDKSCINNKNS